MRTPQLPKWLRALLCRLGFKSFCDPVIGADRVTVKVSTKEKGK